MAKGARMLLVDGTMERSSGRALARSDYAERTVMRLAEKAAVRLDRRILVEEISSGKGMAGDAIGRSARGYDGVIIGPAGLVHTIDDKHAIGILEGGRELASGEVTGMTMGIIAHCESSGIPVLGICSGAQIIARYADETVSELQRGESGFASVHITESGRKHWLFKGLGPGMDVAEDHIFGVVGQKYLTVLAENGVCAQAFTIEGTEIVGVQFHPEANGSAWAGEPAAFEAGERIMRNFFDRCAAQR